MSKSIEINNNLIQSNNTTIQNIKTEIDLLKCIYIYIHI